MTRLPLPLLQRVSSLCADNFDSLVVIYGKYNQLQKALTAQSTEADLFVKIDQLAGIDAAFEESVQMVPVEGVAGNKLILCSTGSLDDDTDDVRKFSGKIFTLNLCRCRCDRYDAC